MEDFAPVRDLIGECLGELGCHVLLAASPPDAAAVVRLRPDVVVLELRLGGREVGWALLRALKAAPRAAGIPVVVCTAAHDLARREADRLGRLASAVVLKPFDLDRLMASISEALGPIDPGRPHPSRPSSKGRA